MVLGNDGEGVTVKFQPQTLKVARSCLRGKVRGEEAEGAEVDPLRMRVRTSEPDLREKQGQLGVEVGMDVDREHRHYAPSTGAPDSGSGNNPAAIPAPGPPCLPVQLPSPHGPPGKGFGMGFLLW